MRWCAINIIIFKIFLNKAQLWASDFLPAIVQLTPALRFINPRLRENFTLAENKMSEPLVITIDLKRSQDTLPVSLQFMLRWSNNNTQNFLRAPSLGLINPCRKERFHPRG